MKYIQSYFIEFGKNIYRQKKEIDHMCNNDKPWP